MENKIIEHIKSLNDEHLNKELENEQKNARALKQYIMNKAKSYLKSNGWVEDEVVYGWAIHFYQEPIEDIKKEFENKEQVKGEVIHSEDKKQADSTNEYIKQAKEKVKKQEPKHKENDIPDNQINLFDLLGE